MKISLKALAHTALLSTAVLLNACNNSSSTGTATGDADIKAREDIMKNWGDAMGVMGDMVKNPDTFNADTFKEQAGFLAGDAANPWGFFKDKEAMGGSTAAVWDNPEGFKAEADKFQQVTAELNQAAQNATSVDDIKEQFGAVGATCKSCHTEFKQPND